MGWIIALLGLAASAGGGWAIAMGWPIVSLERGWTMVVGGSALGSAGVICLAFAAQIFETRRVRLAVERGLERLATQLREGQATRTPPPPSPIREAEAVEPPRPAPSAAPRPAPGEALVLPPLPPRVPPGEPRPARLSEATAADETQPARSFTVGDTTFVVFADGSIEARTAEGTKRFASMEEVRAYLETSVS
jgi:hypothetical protein